MIILRFLAFRNRDFSLSCWCSKFEMAQRDSILWPCCKWTTTYRWILSHSLMKKLGLNWLELLVEHSPTWMHLVDLLKLQAGNVEEIADVELDYARTYPLPIWNNPRLSLTVINRLTFLALQHSAHAAIHDLVSRTKLLEAPVLLVYTRGKRAWSEDF